MGGEGEGGEASAGSLAARAGSAARFNSFFPTGRRGLAGCLPPAAACELGVNVNSAVSVQLGSHVSASARL